MLAFLSRPIVAVDMFWNLVSTRYERYHISHFIMLLIITLYSLLGAFCFCALERNHEEKVLEDRAEGRKIRQQIARHRLITDMQYYFLRKVNITALLSANLGELLDNYDDQMDFHKQPEDPRYSEKPRWDIWGGLYYAGTIYTTIGYGDITAKTTGGRAFTIVYAVIGIPLVITVLNIWGGGLFQLMEGLWRKYLVRSAKFIKRRATRVRVPDDSEAIDDDDECGGLFLDATESALDREEAEHPHLPLKLALAVIALWFLMCTGVFMFFQKWDFFTAFYFCSVSLTTVGLGDVTVPHKVAVLNFILIMLGLSVVSMSINIIQVHIEALFARIIRSIDSDFKKNLIAERRKVSMGVGVMELPNERKSSSMVISIPVPTPQQQAEFRNSSQTSLLDGQTPPGAVGAAGEADALQRYATEMPVTDRFLMRLMSSHQKRLLNQRLQERIKMRNKACQTEERKTSTEAQTDYIKRLDPFQPFRASTYTSSTVTSSSSSEDEAPASSASAAQQFMGGKAGAGGQKAATGVQKPPRKRGLSRKKLYIYNIAD